jgi:hypothetical protein
VACEREETNHSTNGKNATRIDKDITNMAQKLSRGEVQDLVSKFAAENPKYRAALISDPKGTIERQLNAPLGSTKVVAVADTADTYHIVVPYVAAEGELSDSDLEKVAGGLADKTANCNESPGAMNTFIQLNL